MKIPLYLLSLLLLAGCSQYQYITLGSDIRSNADHSFVWDNDTVRVQYTFSGRNCPLSITIYNKLSQPIDVHWNNSAVVYRDGTKLRLWNDKVEMKETKEIISRSGKRTQKEITRKTVMGATEPVSHILPNGHITERPIAVTSAFIMPLLLKYKQYSPEGNSDNAKAEKFNYKRDESPFIFRCVLSVSGGNDARATRIEHSFWASGIVLTMIGPSSIAPANDKFYISRSNLLSGSSGRIGTSAFVARPIYFGGTAAETDRFSKSGQ